MTIIAHHLIWTNYGTWLPNDPRGSGSQKVYTPALAELGEVHYGRRKIQPRRTAVREFCQQAESRLQFPVVRFTMQQINDIAIAFAETVKIHRYTCYSCAIMPDHVHLVIRKHKHRGELIIENFQIDSRQRLQLLGLVQADHPVWTKNGWNVYLDTPAAVCERVSYVENNPVKECLPRQKWPFVVAYDNWPFHKRRS